MTVIALRFTTNRDERNITSEDQVNKVKFAGLCAYDITSEVEQMIEDGYSIEDAYQIIARKQAEFDNWHAHNTSGNYVIFEGTFVSLERDNFDFLGNRAVIVKLNNYLAYGKLDQMAYGYKCNSIELV